MNSSLQFGNDLERRYVLIKRISNTVLPNEISRMYYSLPCKICYVYNVHVTDTEIKLSAFLRSSVARPMMQCVCVYAVVSEVRSLYCIFLCCNFCCNTVPLCCYVVMLPLNGATKKCGNWIQTYLDICIAIFFKSCQN